MRRKTPTYMTAKPLYEGAAQYAFPRLEVHEFQESSYVGSTHHPVTSFVIICEG